MLRHIWPASAILALVLIFNVEALMKEQGRIINSGDEDQDNSSLQEKQVYFPTEPVPYQPTTEKPTEGPSQNIINIITNPRIRGPMAVLVDTEPEALNQAQDIWEEALDELRYLPFNVILMAYNESEKVRTLTIRNIQNFRQAMESLPPSVQRKNVNGSASFFTVLKATQQVPMDSAILLFTGRSPNDADLSQLAIQTLIKKRCRLYVWWSAVPSTKLLSTTRLLQQVTERSGGSFFNTNKDDVQITNLPLNKTIMAVRRKVTGDQEIPFYLDSTVQGITITIVGNMTGVHLQPPGGEVDINLQDPMDIRDIGAQLIQNQTALVEIYLSTSNASFPGLWKLATSGVGGASAQVARYDVIVEGYSRLGFSPVSFKASNTSLTGNNGTPLLFNVEGDITNITGVTILDQTGQEVKTAFYKQEITTHRPDGGVTLELEVPAQELPTGPFYLQFKGHDFRGEQFSRLAYVQSAGYQQSRMLVVDLSDNSELFVLPGQTTRLFFRVTNNNSLPTQVHISCASRFTNFVNVQPFDLSLQPYQTVVHVVTLYPQANVRIGSTDVITFNATNRFERVTVPVLLKIGDKPYDYEKPSFQYTFQSNCKGVEAKDCSSKSWAVTATVQDKTSGLLRIHSQPRGIRFDTGFMIGSQDPVTFTYSETCCNSKLNLYITDAQNNTVEQSLNAYDTASGLSEGEIAAIALGVIILIIIIVIIVVVIVRKRRRTHTFQTHQTPR